MADTISLPPITCPYTVLIDTREQTPWLFTGLHADASRGSRPLVVPVQRQCLGNGLGDYSILGHEPNRVSGVAVPPGESGPGAVPSLAVVPRLSIERKSIQDCIGTILGFGDGHRERFEKELANLAEIVATGGSACVIVEASLRDVLWSVEARGSKPADSLRKTLFRSIVAYQQDYPGVPWWFADDRRLAEVLAFRWIDRFARRQWKKGEGAVPCPTSGPSAVTEARRPTGEGA